MFKSLPLHNINVTLQIKNGIFPEALLNIRRTFDCMQVISPMRIFSLCNCIVTRTEVKGEYTHVKLGALTHTETPPKDTISGHASYILITGKAWDEHIREDYDYKFEYSDALTSSYEVMGDGALEGGLDFPV